MATEFYVTVEGSRQGRLQGESIREAHRDQLTGLSFRYAVTSPRDVASGAASGRRQHQPVSFVKEWGPASPQLFQALVTNEALTKVRFEFVRDSADGEEIVYQTLELSNASITAIEQYLNGEPDPPPDPRALEKISFTFQHIEITNLAGQTTAVDDIRGR
ncbi:MAG: type VI secretion system tube protein Hcp [Marmoricola sp.]